MKRYWMTLVVIIACALGYKLLVEFIPSSFNWLITLIYCIMLLVIGSFFDSQSRKNNRWLGKVVVALVVVFIVGIRLNLFAVYEFSNLLSLVGLNGTFLDLLLVYCGWAFFQV